jgi:hypothetical protein
VERGRDSGRDGDGRPPEELERERGEEHGEQRAEQGVGDLRDGDDVGMSEGDRGEEDRVGRRPEEEGLDPNRVLPGLDERPRRCDVRARVAEPESREADRGSRDQPDREREQEDSDEGAAGRPRFDPFVSRGRTPPSRASSSPMP